jgi:Nucleotidyl transferase AbiEii toxin, Type IV TA system
MTPEPAGFFPYVSAAAFRSALRDRLAALAKQQGTHGLGELQRQFAYDRLLARVFDGPDADRWILKGAGALLARLPDARHSRDLDLAYSARHQKTEPRQASAVAQEASVAEAVAELTAAADRDLGDHFRFEITRTSPLQEQALGRRVDLVAYLGTRYAAFHVDVVLGTAMTGPPEQFPPLIPLHIEGLVRPRYQLFPLVDHVADKVCATFQVHTRAGGQQPSTRVKDLVDLTLIASTQTIDGAALRTAITVGAAHRRLTLPDRFSVPDLDVWRAGYPSKAREAPGATPGFDDAVVLVGRFLDPILAGQPVSTWDPRHTAWTTPAAE